MSKLDQYYSTKKALDELTAQLKKLEGDQDLKKAFEFQEKLNKLMSDYGKTSDDVLAVLGLAKSGRKASGAKGTGAKRALKVYKNPKTGEVVETRGGNHKVLNAWRQQFGKEKVDSWLQK